MHAQATTGNSNLQKKFQSGKKKGFPERSDLNIFYDKYINIEDIYCMDSTLN